MVTGMGVAERVRERRDVLGYSQEGLAQSAGIGAATVVRVEGGKFHPKAGTIAALARALRTSQAYLLGETDDPRPPEPTGPPPEPTLADAARLARDLANVLEHLARGSGGG
jgi:transcriptional regulator with XRE-family HTH domain